ncbi:hypothetical protein ACHAPO_006515, partial [Fusarium lateritium]
LLQKHSIPKSYISTARRRLGTRWKITKIQSQPYKTTVSSSDANKESLRTTQSRIQDPGASWSQTDGELQIELCRQRDHNRCVFTHSAKDVVVTHIIPRAWNDTKENMELTRKVIHAVPIFLDEGIDDNYDPLFADLHSLGTTEKCWNMISLDRQLQWYLDHRYLGLKCLSIDRCVEDDTNCIITIQLNWLYRNKNKPKEVTLEGDGNDFDKLVNEIRHFEDHHQIEPGQDISATGIPLTSGQLARIKMSREDARKCRVMLDVGWFLSVVAGISGATEWPKFLPDHDAWFPIQHSIAIDCWVEDQVRLRMDELQADEQYLHQRMPLEQAPRSVKAVSDTDEQDQSTNWGLYLLSKAKETK